MKRFFTYSVLFAALLFLAGCGGEETTVPEPEQPEQPVQPDAPNPTPPSEEETSVFVPIDWEQTELRDFDAENGEVTLAFGGSGEVPRFDAGRSVMVIETDTSAHIRRVMQSEADGSTVRLQTVQANMTELFADTEFAVSLTPSAARTRTRTGSVTSIDEAGVLHPVKIVQLNGDGTYRKLYDAKGQSRVDIGAESRIDLYNVNHSGKIIASSPDENLKLSWKSFLQQITLKADATFKFTEPIRDVELTEDFKIKVSELESCRFTFGFDWVSEAILRGDMNGRFNLNPKKPFPLGKEFKPVVYTFMTPSGVPVVFTLSSRFYADIAADGNTVNHAEGGMSMKGGIDVGFEYDGVWRPVTNPRNKFEVYPLEIEGKAEVNWKVWAYPELRLKLYDFLGPVVSPKPYVREEFKSGYFDQFGTAERDYYALSQKLFAGIDLQIDLLLDFIGMKKQLALIKGNLTDKLFYDSPHDIKLVSPAESGTFTIGEAIPVRFNVVAELMGIDVPLDLTPVKFVSEKGKVSQDFAVTGPLGNADVEWTPEAEGATLTAQIFDADGEVLLENVFAPEVEEMPAEKWTTRTGIIAQDLDGTILDEAYWDDELLLFENGMYHYTHNPNEVGIEWTHDGLPYNSVQHGSCEGKYRFTEEPIQLILNVEKVVDSSTSNGHPRPGHITYIKYLFGKSGTYDIYPVMNEDGSLNEYAFDIHFSDDQGNRMGVVFTKSPDSPQTASRSSQADIPVTVLTVDDAGNVKNRSVEWHPRLP